MALKLIAVDIHSTLGSMVSTEALGVRQTHDVKGRNVATFFMVNTLGERYTVTKVSSGAHSETLCWNDIQVPGGPADKIYAAYTDREPCGPDNHNCAAKLEVWLGKVGVGGVNAPVFYMVTYPDTKDILPGMIAGLGGPGQPEVASGEAEALSRQMAAEARKLGSNAVKRLETVVRGKSPYAGPGFGDWDGTGVAGRSLTTAAEIAWIQYMQTYFAKKVKP